MNRVFIPAIFWACAVAVADLVIYPFVITPSVPDCDVPGPAIAYSPDHFVRVLTLFFAFLVFGVVVFGVVRLFGRRWMAAIAMTGVCLTVSAMSFDHDYPKCNSFTPQQSLTLALGIFVVPTFLVWLAWRLRRWGERAVK
jgi:hypothetical protein